jgi:hypothetical protein
VGERGARRGVEPVGVGAAVAQRVRHAAHGGAVGRAVEADLPGDPAH